MNDIEIRALYRDLMEPAPDLETANRQRKLAAGVISALFQKVESLREENRRIAGEVMKIQRTDGVRDASVTYTMTYADAATHKQVADLACTVLCGLTSKTSSATPTTLTGYGSLWKRTRTGGALFCR